MYTDQPIFDAMAAATQIDKEPDGVPRIVMSAAKFIEVFNNHRDRALCTSLNVFAQCAPTPEYERVLADFIGEAQDRLGPGCDELALAQAILRIFHVRSLSPIQESAPVLLASHNSGEGDLSVMPDCAGADTTAVTSTDGCHK